MPQLFKLEILKACHGDCLLLHYGSTDKPRLLLIDGGPRGTWRSFLKPHLTALRAARGNGRLALDHVMVSHLDSDHIAGVLDLVESIEEDSSIFWARHFWFNTFDDGMAALPPEVASARAELGLDQAAAIKASVEQASIAEGQRLRDAVARLAVPVNDAGQLLLAEDGPMRLPMPGLDATLISPNRTLLRRLAMKWQQKTMETAAYLDSSVYNLASLVLVVQPAEGGARILLTGDARGDHILEGLDDAGFMDNGKVHFDVLKVPHHGSDRNAEKAFFEAVTADHYVISGDGRHHNPSESVLAWIAETAPRRAKVWLTYDTNPAFPALDATVQALHAQFPKFAKRIVVPGGEARSLVIEL